MPTMIPFRRLLRLAAVVPMLALATACDDDETAPEQEPTFTRMILTLQPTGGAPQTVEITRANAAVSGPLTIPAAGGTLTARFLTSTGVDDPLIAANPSTFETRITSTSLTQATFTRTGPNAFTVTRNAAGNGSITVQLWHLEEGHDELEATVTVNVQ
jgi:hypothetical protein